MAHCLMQINQCGFPNCAQHFANQYDLTAHIEYTHIPMIEEEVKRKAIAAANSSNGDQPLQQSPNNLPLSYYSRVFRTAYRPNPIKPEPLKVSFNHYKKRIAREKQLHPSHQYHRIYREMMAKQGRNISLEDAERRLNDVDFEECGPENNEVRYRCQIVDCMKRYKSMFALRMHMKVLHAVSVSEDAKSLTNFPPEDIKPTLPISQPQSNQQIVGPQQDNQVSSGTQPNLITSNSSNIPLVQGSLLPSVPKSSGNPAANTTSYKCTYCSKRYKTSSGLSNHMMTTHEKISDIQDAPSQQVVEQLISQARMQRQQQEQNSNDQNQQRGTPTSQQQTIGNSSHVRSYTVTTAAPPLRFSQQHYSVNLDNQPSTGQVLQMQMQHQRRMKQLQEQQAAAAAAQQQQQQQQQQQMQHHSLQQSIQQQQQQHQPHQSAPNNVAQGPPQQQFAAPVGQQSGPSMVQQQVMQSQQGGQQQQLMQQPQQFHHLPLQQQPQQNQYPQQMQHHPMNQAMQHHHYQQQNQYQHQQSPQFPYQQPSPHHPPPQQQQQQQQGPPQRSPIPLSQALPPLNSMTQQRAPMPAPNSAPMHLSPPNPQRPMDHAGYSIMSSPPNGQHPQQQQQLQHPPPPPYNM